MPNSPPAAAPRARPDPAPSPSEAAVLELAALQATLPPLPPAGGADRPTSATSSTPAPAPGAEP